MQVHPNKLLGLLGDHEDFPVEVLKFSHDKKLIGSVSHTNKVHFWDVAYLYDEDDDEEGDEDEEKAAAPGAAASDEDMEDSSDDEGGAAGGRRALPTANETFFADL